MRLGVPRGMFYYDYYGFIRRLFSECDIEIIEGPENDGAILSLGSRFAVDEACIPVKLMAGQVEVLFDNCDKVFIPRIEKNFSGKWSCPKLIGLPELLMKTSMNSKLLTTEPLDFSSKTAVGNRLWHACRQIGMDRRTFKDNFNNAYEFQKNISKGNRSMHVEADWEFMPTPSEDEIILPNIGKVLLVGHSYNVFDKFTNGEVIKKLDDLGLDAITEKSVMHNDKEMAVKKLGLIKTPFWDTLVRTLGTVLCMKEQVEGIVYLSSFSCGQDPFIIEMIKNYVDDIPVMVLKLDEHKGEAGYDTRLEAFADLLDRRRAS